METMKIKTVDEGMQMSVIASVAFEANRQYCEMIGGKAFNPSWTEVGQDVRDALIESVKVALMDKIVSAELSHLRWAAVRVEAGWSIGPRFDPHRKTDPNLVPFRELSVQEQLKDILFLAVVNSLGAALGYREFDDDPLSPETIQEHQEKVSDLEIAATGKTDFVPGTGKDDKPESPEDNKLGVVDTIDEHTSSGQGPETAQRPDESPPGEDQRVEGFVPGEAGYEPPPNDALPPDEFAARSEDFEKDRTAEPTQAPLPNDSDLSPLEKAAKIGQAASDTLDKSNPLPEQEQHPKGFVPGSDQAPLPDADPVDHAATKAKKAKKK